VADKQVRHRFSPFSAFPGGLSLDSCMVDPSEARHMGQMHHFLPFDKVLVPRAREYAVSICLYSLNCPYTANLLKVAKSVT